MNSDSSSEYTTSESTTSDSSDDERFEAVQACGVRLRLPEPLCRQKEIFDEFFSSHAWNSLTDNSRQRLSRLLPTFPEDDEHEKYVTLQRLLSGDAFRFSSPLSEFHRRLKSGYYRPETSKMRYMVRRAERDEAKRRYRKFREQLKNDVLESRRGLLSAVGALPPGAEPRLSERTGANISSYVSSISYRTKVRYFQELATIKSKMDETGFSSDDNYPDGPPVPVSRKQKRQLNSLRNSQPGNIVVSTMAAKPCLDLEKHITPNHNPFLINDETYKKLLLNHKRQKIDEPLCYERNTKGLSISDIINRTKLSYVKKAPVVAVKRRMEKKIKSRKKIRKIPQPIPPQSPEIITKANPFFGLSSHSEIESDSDSLLERNLFKRQSKKSSPIRENHFKSLNPIHSPEKASSPILNSIKSPYTPYGKIVPASFSDLDAIGMMNLPIDFEEDCMDILETNRAELMQKTHTNFLSVIRDLICSTSDHRIDYSTLEERLKQWQENPISTLNDWYSSADNWIQLLKSAVDFLSGNSSQLPPDFVPYIEYKSQLDLYQWIGAGRDSDTSLSGLAKYWLDHRNETKHFSKDEKEEIEVSDRSQTPPPPRCPTNWSVRRADVDEIRTYQEQERRRYDNPHKSFTFRCNGYESVVGPLKGIYSAGAGSSKARGHTMLSADRPNFVTILSLVRDATARLPNGEGTRADICELLKSSQYISPTAPDNVLQSVVSGALDRMHTQFDPCVKYDPKRKIWIYLHRNRSEEDFERIHQQYQNVGKTPKKINKNKSPSKTKVRTERIKHKESPSPTLDKQKSQKAKPNSNTNSPEPSTSTTVSPGTSLLLPQLNKLAKLETNEVRTPSPAKISKQEEKEINDALQTIMQTPSPKQKSLVKIITTTSQGKSLIIPSNCKAENPTKSPQAQLLQQKISTQPIKLEVNEKAEPKVQTKVPISVQQQILQTIGQTQQFKNVALIRNVSQKLNQQSGNATQTIAIAQNTVNSQQIQVSTPITVTRSAETGIQQIRVQQTTLTPTQQQQILQSLKQKVVPMQSSVLAGQQVVVKHKGGVSQVQKAASTSGTSLLTQSRVNTDAVSTKSIISTNQTPLVAKVLTNAAGQVISVESLLAHQKQHGSLPQGTTVRVSGMKSTATNIIQLATPTKQSPVAQLAVGSQNNIIAITNQPKLVLSSQSVATTTSVTTTIKSTSKNLKTQTVTKFTPKIAQQLINAKFVQNVDNKIVQSKMFLGQNQLKAATAASKTVAVNKSVSVTGNTNTIRMVNAANLNLTHIAGKPVLLASKGSTLQNLQGQNVIIQSQANSISQNTTGVSVLNQANTQYVLAPQTIKVQQTPQVLLSSSSVKSNVQQSQGGTQSQLVLGGQPVRLQSSAASNQRVVLASQGQGGQIVAQQILLPAGFQGTAINIKALQGVKVIPIAQAQQAKGMQNRQVFARVMAPNIVRTVQATQEGEASTPTSE